MLPPLCTLSLLPHCQGGSAATHSRQQVAATAIAVLLQPSMLVPLYLMLYVYLGGAACCCHVCM